MSTARLPDPRRFGVADGAGELAAQANAPDGDQQVATLLQQMLAAGDDAAIFHALRAAPTHEAYARLWRMLCAAVDAPAADADSVQTRIFALPLVLVAGADRPALIPGVVPDIAAVDALLSEHGAVGPSRNFGFANSLCSLETLEAIRPSRLFRWARGLGNHQAPQDVGGSEITVERGREHAHLRFLLGAGVVAGSAPSFVETAANIGAWGMPLTRALGAQLAQPGLQLLALPRPPKSVLDAAYYGRFAQLEVALHLFASNTVRNIRRAAGDPLAVIAAHANGEVRLSLCAQFDDSLSEGFSWPLHPLDDFDDIRSRIETLLAQCKVSNVQTVGQLMPADDRDGRPLYVKAADMSRLESLLARH